MTPTITPTDITTQAKGHKVSILNYSLGEELVSAISHGLGAALAIVGLVLCLVKSTQANDPWMIVAASIFGGSMFILYICSCLYHALGKNMAKRVFRVIDHCCVFLLIAGTYTPFLLISIRGAWGWTLFGIIWGLTIIGIVFNAIDVERYEALSAVINVIMGWMIVFRVRELAAAIGSQGIALLLAGGIIYTIGAILYGIGSRVKYMHSIWHFFVLGGTIFHFFAIYWCVL